MFDPRTKYQSVYFLHYFPFQDLQNCRRKYYLEANEFLSRFHEHERYHHAFMVLNNFYILQKIYIFF